MTSHGLKKKQYIKTELILPSSNGKTFNVSEMQGIGKGGILDLSFNETSLLYCD